MAATRGWRWEGRRLDQGMGWEAGFSDLISSFVFAPAPTRHDRRQTGYRFDWDLGGQAEPSPRADPVFLYTRACARLWIFVEY